jgi:hypothetical protein
MEHTLKHLKTLIKVASDTDDVELIHRLLREMSGIIDNATAPTPPPPKPTMPYLRSVK